MFKVQKRKTEINTHPNSILACKRNLAKGAVHYVVKMLDVLEPDSLYSEELIALETMRKIAEKLKKEWKSEIPEYKRRKA